METYMHYHIIIDGKEKTGKSKDKNKQYFELDKTDLSKIEEEIVKPYLDNEEFLFMGSFLNKSNIERIQIRETEKKAQEIADSANNEFRNNMRQAGVFVSMSYSPMQVVQIDKHSKDITNIVLKNVKPIKNDPTETAKSNSHLKIFIVHGRDDEAKTKTARFIEKLGFTAIILHEQSNSGKTIIEKIEEHTDDVGFAIILYTPCDIGGLADSSSQKARARQYVVFEHGYLMA